MVGAPVAGVFGFASTAADASLVSVSALPASSLKDTFTLMALPMSALARVWEESVAPDISAPSASHW